MKYPILYKGAVGFPRLIDENIIAMLNNEDSFFSDDEPKPELNLPMLNDNNVMVMREAKTRDDEDDRSQVIPMEVESPHVPELATQDNAMEMSDQLTQPEMDSHDVDETQEVQSRVCYQCKTAEDSEHDSRLDFVMCVQNDCYCHCCILCVRVQLSAMWHDVL